MKLRMVNFLGKNSFLSPLQFGFRKNKNTEQAILTFLEQISEGIDRRLKSSALFVDLTKAFDRVKHSSLLKKLFCSGFRGNIYNWFRDYLNGRTQVVRINNVLSGELPVRVGVPQGSVLGPLLFLIYINGIFCLPFRGSLTAFADDLSFAYKGTSTLANTTDIDHDLNVLSSWLKAHNLLLSDKTKIVHFKNTNNINISNSFHVFGCKRDSTCCVNGCFEIKLVNEIKYLGIMLDSNLNWKSQIESLKSKLRLVSRKVYVLRQFCPLYLLRLVYFALVDSLLLYGLSCWGCACKTLINPLYMRQKHILRLMSRKDSLSPSWPIFQEMDILPLQHMFVFKVLKLFYIISGNNFVNYPDYNLRLNLGFKKHVPNVNLEFRRRFFSVVSPMMFNNLPIEIRMCSSFPVFSKMLKQWLKQNQTVDKLFILQQ